MSKYVLLEKQDSTCYITGNSQLETIGYCDADVCATAGRRSGHFAEDLQLVVKFTSKKNAWAFLKEMWAYDMEVFARSEWRLEPYVDFEKRVLTSYLAKSAKERDAMSKTQYPSIPPVLIIA
jgi:hypothetical protein